MLAFEARRDAYLDEQSALDARCLPTRNPTDRQQEVTMSEEIHANQPTPTSYLIKRLVLTQAQSGRTVVNLFAPPLQYPVLQLFDFSLLFQVGIDPNALEAGRDIHCLFIAHFETGEKRNQRGNAYKNVTHLEPVRKPGAEALDLLQRVFDSQKHIWTRLGVIEAAVQQLAAEGGGP